MLTKVFSEFKHLILKLSDIILNLTELKDEDLETYMNMTTSEYIKLLKEKDKNISEMNKLLDNKEKHIVYLSNEIESLNEYISYQDEIIESYDKEIDQTVNKYEDRIDVLLREFKTEREEAERRFNEQTRQHQETINNLNRQVEKPKKRYKKTFNELRLNRAETITKIEDHSKNTLERRTTNPSIPSKVECLRIYITKIDLNEAEDSLIDLYSNRCQKENLKNLDINEYNIIYNEELLTNSVELYNNFLNELSIEYIRINCNKIQIKRRYLDQFTDALTNFVSASNSLNTNKVIPEEISNNPNLNISMFTEFFNYKYYLNNRYRDLFYCESRQCLKFILKVNNETVFIEDPQELVGTRCRDDSGTIHVINSIEFINNKYHILCISV